MFGSTVKDLKLISDLRFWSTEEMSVLTVITLNLTTAESIVPPLYILIVFCRVKLMSYSRFKMTCDGTPKLFPGIMRVTSCHILGLKFLWLDACN